MVHTIISEPRSGSSHLIDWIRVAVPNFVVCPEPWLNQQSEFDTQGKDISYVDWIDNFNNIFIKEIYYEHENYTNLLNKSEKVICLYRKNWYSQIRSLLFQERQNGFLFNYEKKEVDKIITEEMILEKYRSHHIFHKKNFQDFILKNNLVSISYEELYYGNGLEKFKNHFNINSDFKFPLYERHLKNDGKEIGLEKLPIKNLI
jgi:hypothetical protein